jgi:late competence protein required for DNA uptake (superfamily II DNA/RNA helicase)
VFQTIITASVVSNVMSTKLLSPELELDLQEEEEEQDESNDQIIKSVEQEIECPRCSDIMTLTSDFDRLLYLCQECDLLSRM